MWYDIFSFAEVTKLNLLGLTLSKAESIVLQIFQS